MMRAWPCVLLLAACKPAPGPSLSIITEPRVIALAGDPAEAAPGDAVTLSALVASPYGTSTTPLDWSLCLFPRPLGTNDVVAPACLSIDQVQYVAYALPSVRTQLPANACALFGPELPPSSPDAAPVQPDATGGYYQPYRADLEAAFSVGLERIRCHPAGASADLASAFRQSYAPNRNPTIAAFTLDGAPAAGAHVAAGAHAALALDWPDDAQETYPILDVAAQALTPHREAMRVSWFATAGAFDEERTGRAGDDPTLGSSDGWTAPSSPATVWLWAVLRDDRGGAVWAQAQINVE